MEYTVRIQDKSEQSHSIIKMLKAFSRDYDFLQVYEEPPNKLTKEQEKELDRRYQYFLQNPDKGQSWEEVKNELFQ